MSDVAKAAPGRHVYKHERGYVIGVDIAGAAPDLMHSLSRLNEGFRMCRGHVIMTPEHLHPDIRAKDGEDHTEPRANTEHTEPRANTDDGVVLMLVDTIDGLPSRFMRDECCVQLLYEEEQIVVSEPNPRGLKQYRWSEYLQGHEAALALACGIHPCVKMTDLTRVLDELGFQSTSLNRLRSTTLELMSQHDTLKDFLPQWLRNLAIYVPGGVDITEVDIATNDVRAMLADVLGTYTRGGAN